MMDWILPFLIAVLTGAPIESLAAQSGEIEVGFHAGADIEGG